MVWLKSRKGFFTLLGLLFVLVIIFILCYITFNTYFKMPSINRSTNQSLSESGIDTSSYQSIRGTARETIEDFNKQQAHRMEKIRRQLE